MDDLRWRRAFVNGLILWLVGIVVAMVPGMVYVFWRGVQLAPEATAPMALFRQISAEVANLYAHSGLLIAGVVAITAVLTFWRAAAVANGTWHMRWANGLIVGGVPAALSLLSGLCGGLSVLNALTVGVYLLAGLLGGLVARPT